jgi:hypothetical protein
MVTIVSHVPSQEGTASQSGDSRTCLPTRRYAEATVYEYDGQSYRAAYGFLSDGRLGEIFLDVIGKSAGSAIQEHASTSAILVSLCLQHGVSVATIRHSISGPIARALELAP